MGQRMRNNPMLLVWILALTVTAVNASDVKIVGTPAEAPSVSPAIDLAAKQTSANVTDETTAPCLPQPPNRPLPAKAELQSMIDQFAGDYGLDPDLVHALIRAESAYDPQAVSRVGAVGLMQVMPETAADYGVDSVDRLFEPEINLRTGMRHLKRLIEKYDGIGSAVMAYNAGEGALERGKGFVNYPETQRYTHQVLSAYLIKKGIQPYSPDARRALGMTLTPDMALAGFDGRSNTPRLRQAATRQSFGMVAAQTSPDAPQVGARDPRTRATRLSSRLAVPGHSLLKSRLIDPTRRAVSVPGRSGLLRMRPD